MQPSPTQLDMDGEHLPVKVLLSEHNCYHQFFLQMNDREGWSSKLRHYLNDRPGDITKDTNIVKWWQDHTMLFPTIAHIAIDIFSC